MNVPALAAVVCAHSLALCYLLSGGPEQRETGLFRACESELRELLDTRASLAWYKALSQVLFISIVFILGIVAFAGYYLHPFISAGGFGSSSGTARPVKGPGKGTLQ